MSVCVCGSVCVCVRADPTDLQLENISLVNWHFEFDAISALIGLWVQ